jgi:hypothetical protein
VQSGALCIGQATNGELQATDLMPATLRSKRQLQAADFADDADWYVAASCPDTSSESKCKFKMISFDRDGASLSAE